MIQLHDNPHYWLQQDILQNKQFQYRFFQNIILNEDTVPQIKIFSHFLLKVLRFNYQLLWEQQDQSAYIDFPQLLTETALLPIIISIRNKHVHYRDLNSFNTTLLEIINFDYHLIVEHSETSDNRPYTSSNIITKTSIEEYIPNLLRHETGQNNLHSNQDDHTELFQNREPQQFNIVPNQQKDTTTLQNVPNPSETATIQNKSELSDITMNNPKSFTKTNDSNILQTPVHNITENTFSEQNQNDTTQYKPRKYIYLVYIKYSYNSTILNTTNLTSKL